MKKESLLKLAAALKNDLAEAREELSYLERTTKIHCAPIQRKRRHELAELIKEFKCRIRSVEYTLTELQWTGGVSA